MTTPRYPGVADIKVLHTTTLGTFDITELVESVTWSGDIKQAYRSLDVSISNTTNGRKRRVGIALGGEVRLFNHGKELFRGLVFKDGINDKGSHNFNAYDTNVYLTKNTDDRKFKKLTASAIIRRLCGDFDIKVGQIDDTGYVIPRLYFTDGATLYDMMVTALTETEKATGRRYFITNTDGKLNVLKRSKKTSQFILENGVNLIDASYSRSIDDLRSQVKLVGGEEGGEIVATLKNDALIRKFGTMQHYEAISDKDVTKSDLQQKARELLKSLGTIDDEASISALGIDSVISASSVYVKESMTRIVGGYYVASDSHTFSNGVHEMSIKLSATDDLPRLEYEEKEAIE